MTILVTGAGGLTGGETVRRLVASGARVIGVVRRPDQAHGAPKGTEIEVADCADPEAMDPLLARCDAMIHVAGIHLGSALAGARQLNRISSLVAVSTAGVNSAHRASADVYRRGEEALRAARPDAVVVRPTMIYGSSRDRNVHRVIEFASRYGFLPLFGRGDGLLQPIHYADLAEALVRLVGARTTDPVPAGGAAPLTLRAAAEAIFAALGRPPRFLPLPLAPSLFAARAIDALAGTRIAERLLRTQEDRSVDNTRLLELTGLAPHDFATGVRHQVEEMRVDSRLRA